MSFSQVSLNAITNLDVGRLERSTPRLNDLDLPSLAAASSSGEDSSSSNVTTPDELLHFLDSLHSSTATTTSHVTGSTSISHSAQSVPTTIPSFSSSTSNSLGFPFASSSSSSLNSQVKPQHHAPSLSMDGKGLLAGDTSTPFDLPLLPYTDITAFSSLHPNPPTSLPLDTGIDPVALDSSLTSPPLSLSLSQEHSPWEELLASPMFSLPNSEPATGRVPDLPLPPFYPSFDMTGSLFPPLDNSSYLPQPPSTSSTYRPLPPLPVRPDIAPVQGPSPTSSTSSLPGNSQESVKRVEPTGFRTTIPLLGPEAPIQTRKDPVLPSSTTRKRKTAAAEKALAKRGRLSASPPIDTPAPSVSADISTGADGEEELPADIVAAIERKRLQNTMSARKSRARKQKKMQELEDENKALMDENTLLKAQLAAILGTK